MYQKPFKFDRRTFLQRSALAMTGLTVSGLSVSRSVHAQNAESKSDVYLVNTHDHYEASYKALEPLRDEISRAIGNKRVVIKVNAGLASEQYAKNSTHADHIRGILDFLKPIHSGEIIISEGTAGAATSAFIGFENYGYMPLEKEYKAKLVDSNDLPYSQQWIRFAKHHPEPINIINMFMDPDVYLISAARMKTHNAVVGTYSLKNVVMGSPVCHYKEPASQWQNEKNKMHGGDGSSGGRELSYNLFRIAMLGVQPDLAVIDGVTAIEGNGPWGGEIVEHGIGVASTDFVAADRVCIDLMGIDPNWMKYLEWCGQAGMGTFDMDRITVNGPNLRRVRKKYKLHENVKEQVAWIHENFDQ